MALNDIERKRAERSVEAFLERRRPPAHIRPELDLTYRMDGQSVEICEVRPRPNDSSVKMENPVAKVTYVRSRDIWKLFWMRADLKWHGYDPVPQVGSIDEALGVIEADHHACFFG